MARKKRTTQQKEVQDYRHNTATRKNNPPAGIAAQGKIQETPKQEYAYNPHLPPDLRFDPNGDADKFPELLQIAQQRALTAEEAKILADALRHYDGPWLEWAGKQETKSFTVDPVALHIHERVSAKAILKVAERQNVQRELFADPQQDYSKAVDFYQHDVDWANRLILGDSLTVMSSLAHREDLAGKVQMIYIDPPYGIKFASNFQPTVFQRDVKDRAQDLTREREQIKAYRDTWTLGVHSYLAYLRDRLIVAKDLLTDSGSIFVQISDENVHRVRCVMDDVFGSENFHAMINFRSMSPLGQKGIARIYDYILWYAKDINQMKFRPMFFHRDILDESEFSFIDRGDGTYEKLQRSEIQVLSSEELRQVFKRSVLTSSGYTPSCTYDFEYEGKTFSPLSRKSWRTTSEGTQRLSMAKRLLVLGKNLYFRQYHNDFPLIQMENSWTDTAAGFSDSKRYVVETNPKIIQRCLLMTTDPGDLILDPTCGSGTSAYIAEQYGRRWITIDTSRVAVALARQRLLTASFEYYKLKSEQKSISGGFLNKIVPHVMLKSIAQNTALDPIFAKHEPILKEKLNTLNNILTHITKNKTTKHIPPPSKFVQNSLPNWQRKRDAKGSGLSPSQIVAAGYFPIQCGRNGKYRLILILIGPRRCKRH